MEDPDEASSVSAPEVEDERMQVEPTTENKEPEEITIDCAILSPFAGTSLPYEVI
jgi:hypothetical protein